MEDFEKSKMSLQKLCIDVIVNNFERYYSLYSHSDDATVKRRFEFLQRKFSFEMASLLYEKGPLTNEHINLLVNKHLKVLDFDWLKDCPWETIVAKFEEAGPGVETLYFKGEHPGMLLQDLMRHLPNLRIMKYNDHCTDKILTNLGLFCRNVVEIDINYSESVTSEGMKRLCTKTDGQNTGLRLRKLLIDSCFGIDEGIAYLLKNMPSMEEIDYPRLPHTLLSMHEKDLHRINVLKPYNLQSLYISEGGEELLKICSSLCPRVKRLTCYVRAQTDIKFLCNFSKLEELSIRAITEGIDVNELLKSCGQKLRSLLIGGVSLSFLTLADSCPSLKEIDLWDVDLKIDGVVSPFFASLEKCFFGNNLEIIGLLFRGSPKLEEVSFCDIGTMVRPAIKAEILACVKCPIKHIWFSRRVEKSLVRDLLLNCLSLASMTLHDTCLSPEEQLELEEMAALLPNRPEILFTSRFVGRK